MRTTASVCPNCSTALDVSKAKYCPRCGAAVTTAPRSADSTPQPTSQQHSPPAPMTVPTGASPREDAAATARGGTQCIPPVTSVRDASDLNAPATGRHAPSARSGPRPAPTPVHLEPRGSLRNPFFLGSVALVLAGALLAGDGQLRLGLILLALGLPSLLISTVRSLVR